jgi:hypothetical protein
MLDDIINDVIEKIENFVTGEIWLGKANNLIKRLKMNGHGDNLIMTKARQLIEWQSDQNILELYDKYQDNDKI